MRSLIVLVFLIFAMDAFAAKSLSAHAHGEVELEIAAEKNQILIILHSPAESILGFEHKPKNKKEQAKVDAAKKQWNEKYQELFTVSDTDCRPAEKSWKLKVEKGHAEVQGQLLLKCTSPLTGKRLGIALKKAYSGIKEIHLQYISVAGSVINKEYSDKEFDILL